MALLWTIYFCVSNSNLPYSGTTDRIVLTINDGGLADVINFHLRPNYGLIRSPRRRAEALIGNVGARVTTENLNLSSIRVEVSGNNQWRPENMIVWGTTDRGREIIPLAIETDLNILLSTDSDEGKPSQLIRRVGVGDDQTVIGSLFMLMYTHINDNSDTKSRINLEVSLGGGLRVNWRIPRTPQPAQEINGSNFYRIGGFTPFKKSELNSDSVILRISGDDSWLPYQFFLFGADQERARPNYLIPLVHISSWSYGWMSTDSSEGTSYVRLPIIR